MSTEPQVVYYGWSQNVPEEAMKALAQRGVACVFQGIDPEVRERFGLRIGGSPTATVAVVDMGEHSLENALSLLDSCPHLRGKIVVIGQAENKSAEGLVFVTSTGLIDVLNRLI